MAHPAVGETVPERHTVRAARGLIRVVRAWKPSDYYRPDDPLHAHLGKPSRDLCGSFGRKEFERGTCVWCKRPTEDRTTWHNDCLFAYFVARGRVVDMYQRPVIKQGPCEECGGNAEEIDHRIALGVAARSERRLWVRAWWIGNLRWLCHDCHVVKTTADRLLMNALDREAAARADGTEQIGMFPPPSPEDALERSKRMPRRVRSNSEPVRNPSLLGAGGSASVRLL